MCAANARKSEISCNDNQPLKTYCIEEAAFCTFIDFTRAGRENKHHEPAGKIMFWKFMHQYFDPDMKQHCDSTSMH
jgi:hypothetical protein